VAATLGIVPLSPVLALLGVFYSPREWNDPDLEALMVAYDKYGNHN
jgi:hypothetical protein